jgi:nucleoside-diphosphate-sugar epimerase
VAENAFNFGTDNPINALDLVQLMLELADTPELQPDVRGSGALAGEINRQYLNSERARRTLGWRPQVGLEDGLRRTVSWYRNLLAAPEPASSAALGHSA